MSDLAKELALLKAARIDPKEHFQELIRKGFINKEGEVTRLIGGGAEPEEEFREFWEKK